ncbi:YobK [Vibrio nigripulchritudo ATCC 27043]|uniref:SMI1/KNR4 family protein n=1 Tax=Vibrio nigripulchritudo TaxID=28173 RepID=UPI00021C3838|nr:SMI1/KNR4 family protein [Vibrio nigripulchritudo]EGU56866.1 YobK [Vibrio nigripulchritudo ATCC 27043]
MKTIAELVNHLNSNADDEVFWLGQASDEQLHLLESELGAVLPESLKRFFRLVGGGGTVAEEISGIISDDALTDSHGGMLFDTLYCRKEFGLPDYFAVIYFREDEVCWCINLLSEEFGKIVSYNLFKQETYKTMYDSFELFLEEYVELRTE